MLIRVRTDTHVENATYEHDGGESLQAFILEKCIRVPHRVDVREVVPGENAGKVEIVSD